MSENNENIMTEEKTAAEAVQSEASVKSEKKSKLPLIALLLVVAIVVGVAAVAFSSGNGGFDPLFYSEAGGLYMKDLGAPKKDAVEIFASEDEGLYYLSLNTDKTEMIFQCNNMVDDFSAYYIYDLTNPGAAPVELFKEVNSLVKNEQTGVITCLLGKESRLVQYDAELKETVIAQEVDSFAVSPDGSRLVYALKAGGIYLKESGKDSLEISKNGYIEYMNKELTTLYISEDEALYKVSEAGEKQLIDEGVASTGFEAADGYYFKGVRTILLKDFFEDDMLEADSEIKAPADTDAESYELYTQKVIREKIRTLVLNPKATFEVQDVYYYDGNESRLVLKDVFEADESDAYFTEENVPATLFCSVLDVDNMQKVKMSELWAMISKIGEDYGEFSSLDDIFYDIYDAISYLTDIFVEYSEDYFIYKGDFAAPTGIKGMVYDQIIDFNNKVLYLSVDDDDEEGNDVLYKFPITETGLGEAEKISECVSACSTELSEDGRVFYVEEIHPADGEVMSLGGDVISKLYFDSKLIAENIYDVLETNLEKGLVLAERYKLLEDGTPDFEEYPCDTVLYNAETGEELFVTTEENEENHFGFFETDSGKLLLIEEDYTANEGASKVYLIEDGKVQDLKLSIGSPEYFEYMSEELEGYGYTDWENEWEEMIDF